MHEEEKRLVDGFMKSRYGVSLDELEITDTPGFWRDKEAKIHPGHPLHGCIGCSGPFKATYLFNDHYRDEKGRWASPTRTWRKLYNDVEM